MADNSNTCNTAIGWVDDPVCGNACVTGDSCAQISGCCLASPGQSGPWVGVYDCVRTGCNNDGNCEPQWENPSFCGDCLPIDYSTCPPCPVGDTCSIVGCPFGAQCFLPTYGCLRTGCNNDGNCEPQFENSANCFDCMATVTCLPSEIECNNVCITPVCTSNSQCGVGQTCQNAGTCSAQCVNSNPICGDGSCNGGETCSTCSGDCGTCGCPCSGWTNQGCGLAYCAPSSMYRTRTCTPSGCDIETDCIANYAACTGSTCGNGVVESGEQCDNGGSNGACPASCSSSCTTNSCSCLADGQACGGNPSACCSGYCPSIIGAPDVCASQTQCGDGSCNGGETCSTCSSDCGTCTVCGDGSCNSGETCSSCSGDCGTCSYTISGTVFLDRNVNSVYDGSDVLLQGETVLLQDWPATITYATTTTNSVGAYSFSGSAGAQYRIAHRIPAGYIRTTDDSRPLDPLATNEVWDFGIADITAPAVSASISPSYMPTGTSATITATANDTGSGISAVTIFVDGSFARACTNSPCPYTFTPAYGLHTFNATATDAAGNSASSGVQAFTVNDFPSITGPISYTGSCRTNQTITLGCTASDLNQAANTLSVYVWAGECNGANCFNTRSWANGSGTTYYTNFSMDAPPSGGTFTKSLTITQSSGTSIAATCRATDALNMQNSEGQGDSYPLCTVNGCQNPPVITVDSINPNPAKAGSLLIGFTADRALQGNPAVIVVPGSQGAGILPLYNATFVSKSGNSYVYNFTVQQSDANGIADIRISSTGQNDNCPTSRIDNRLVIDTVAPSTSILCNGGACTGIVFGSSVTLTFGCSDATTRCVSTSYMIGSGAAQTYNTSSPPVLASGTYVVSYWSADAAGNNETAQTTSVSVYNATNEEIIIQVRFDGASYLIGQTVPGKVFCFIRDRTTLSMKRNCNLDPNYMSIIVDRGTPKQKDYFTAASINRTYWLTYFMNTTTQNIWVNYRGYNRAYTLSQFYDLPLNTNIFQSEVCVNGTDSGSGLSGQDCNNFTVSSAPLFVDISFPDVGIIIPATTDILNAPNFTKLMPINFGATPYTSNGFISTSCTGVNCRVEFNFVSFDQWTVDPPEVAVWNDFEKAYVPNQLDVASSGFNCNQYATLYVRATQVGGLVATTSEPVFINCNVRVTVKPVEKRLVLGAQPGRLFNVTIWNPKETNKTFHLASTSAGASGYPLQWINFDCQSAADCQAGPVSGDAWLTDDDKARINTPTISARTVYVNMAIAPRSGSFPVTFVATDQSDGSLYSAVATILVFAESLDEFAAWQLAGLLGIVIAILAYSNFDMTHKTRKKRKY